VRGNRLARLRTGLKVELGAFHRSDPLYTLRTPQIRRVTVIFQAPAPKSWQHRAIQKPLEPLFRPLQTNLSQPLSAQVTVFLGNLPDCVIKAAFTSNHPEDPI